MKNLLEKKKSGKQDGRQKKRQKRKAMGAAKRIRDCKVELNDTPNIQMGWRWGWVGLGGHQTSQPSLHRYQLNIPHTIRHRATKQPLPSGNLSMQAITNSQHTYIWNDASGIKLCHSRPGDLPLDLLHPLHVLDPLHLLL